MISIRSKMIATFCSASMLAAAPAAAAARAAPVYDVSPWILMSATAGPASSQALCGAAVAAAAANAAAQAGTPGCVFPTVDAPAPVPVAENAPIGTPAAVAAGGGVGILPLLLGLAALGGLAALLLSNGDGGTQISISP